MASSSDDGQGDPRSSPAVRGECFCGAVTFDVQGPAEFCVHCHCSMCRRVHGAPFVTWVGVPRDSFTLTSGADDLTRFSSSDHGTRSFCSRCGSTLFCESTHEPELIDIVLANFEHPLEPAPEAHVYFDDSVPWVQLSDDLPRFDTVP